MKFLVDINIPQSVIAELQKRNHDVLDYKQVDLQAIDIKLISDAQKEKRIVITRDKDFISLAQFPKYQVPTIVIRLKEQTPEHMTERLLELLKNQKEDVLKTSLTIIKEESAHSHGYL